MISRTRSSVKFNESLVSLVRRRGSSRLTASAVGVFGLLKDAPPVADR